MSYQEGNPDITNRTRTLRGGRSTGSTPKPLYVAVVNDKQYYAIRQIVRSATAAGTIFSVPNDLKRQFYIDGIWISAANDAGAGAAELTVSATVDGVAQVIGSLVVGSDAVNAHNNACSLATATPIRIDNNTNVTLAGSTTILRGIIYGHFEYV